jgi:hypothetical protein
MKPVVVGTYDIGYDRARLVLFDGTGGSGDIRPNESGAMVINVGGDYDTWKHVHRVLLHVALEVAALKCMCIYYPRCESSDDVSSVMIMMDHGQFAEIVGRAAEFVSLCQLDLSKAWRKFKEKKSKEEREMAKRKAKKGGKGGGCK